MNTQIAIQDIKKENFRRVGMVAFGITVDENRKNMEENFKELGYDAYFTSSKVRDIPDELVGLIAPTK